ncbi:hypothetical protein NX059_001065 [Plenodomus lindquistii]|nr:hypothetical protein NX059_001065 [Plenodomus lindquistii]
MRGQEWWPYYGAPYGMEEGDEDNSGDESQSGDSEPDNGEPESLRCTEDEEAMEDDFMVRLRDCLDDVEHDGTFFSFQSMEAYINPGLHINGIGAVGLPLSDRDAQALAKVSKQSPFGKGDATVIDETVRKTWELDTTEFQCRNPAWAPFLETLRSHAVQALGVQVAAHVQPYKLLLYEEGAFFKLHRDTEKVPGMFGTLVISLPSEHTGGQVHLLQSGKQQIIDTAASSAFGLSALAWYSDVQHEIKPVTSGYRLVLTYNLVQDLTLPKQTAAAVDASNARLERLLVHWREFLPLHDFFVYPLTHQYTEASLSLRNLKAEDAAKGRYLEQMCAKNGFYWFLSRMTNSTQEEMYDVDEESENIKIGNTVTPMGKPISLGIGDIAEKFILADVADMYASRNPDSEDEGEYTGNENMPSEYRYHNTVILLLRRDYVVKRFISINYHSLASLLNMFELVRNDAHCPEDVRRRVVAAALEKALSVVAKRDDAQLGGWSYGYEPLGYGAERERKRAEYADVFQTIAEYCYAKDEGFVVSEMLQRTTIDKSWANSPLLVKLVASQIARETTNGAGEAWDRWLSAPLPPVPTYKYANERRHIFESVQQILPTVAILSFVEWSSNEVLMLLRSVKSYSMEDAEPLIELISVIAVETYHEDILPTLADQPHPAGASRFLHLLGTTAVSDASLCSNIVIPTYRRLIPVSSHLMKLNFDDLAKPAHWQYAGRNVADIQISTSALEVVEIIDQSMKLNLADEAVQLLSQCLPTLPPAHDNMWAKWRDVFLFIRTVVELLQKHNHAPLTACVSQWVAEAIHAAWTYITCTRPLQPRDWTRPHVRHGTCSCEPCLAVKHFLMNPAQPSGRFSYSEKIRRHIEYSFNRREDFKFETEKGRSPYTLVIHKTNNQYTRELQESNNEIAELQRQVQGMKSGWLDTMLGGDVIEIARVGPAGASLARAAGDTGNHQLPPLQPLSASRQNSTTVRSIPKSPVRKSHIIDLTEEEP